MSWNEGRSREDSDDELGMIPRWAVVLSLSIFILTQVLFYTVMRSPVQAGHRGVPLPFRLLTSYSWGTALATYVLLVGYISRDVKRRGMRAGIWMLIVVVMPGGIGAIVYFLLRQPIMMRCPSCRTEIASGMHFCPQCQFQMAPVCAQCFRGVNITDVFCVQCGHDLTHDEVPARLQSYRD